MWRSALGQQLDRSLSVGAWASRSSGPEFGPVIGSAGRLQVYNSPTHQDMPVIADEVVQA